MKKVIVKAKLKNREDFEEKLNEVGEDFSPLYWQHDRVFVPRGFRRGMNLPRMIMRTEMKAIDKPARYYVIFRRHIEDSGVDVENRTVVKDYIEMAEMLSQLGMEKIAEVSKRRQEIKLKNSTMLYLDKIEGVNGYYVKIEAELKEGEKVSEKYDEIINTLKNFGAENIVIKAYFE